MKLITSVLSLAAVLLTTGCSATEPATPAQDADTYSLLIQGYNYTDQYIDSFTVNGVGGGNVFVSSPTTGGGKSTCCYQLRSRSTVPVIVRWAASYCSYTTTNKYGETHTWRKNLWREEKVLLTRGDSGVPKALEVHFYPDGHVEVAATAGYSPPRLKLPITADEQRPGASHAYPRCSDE